MVNNTVDKPADENPGSGSTTPKDPSVENGEKIIEVQKKLEDTSEEDKKKDADQWRNEG